MSGFLAAAAITLSLTQPAAPHTLVPGQAVPGRRCACVAPGDRGFEAGLVWQGNDELSLGQIAGLLAPMLWFSSDEPLLLDGQGPLPHPHPCDPDRSRPVVYYQLHGVRLVSERPVTIPEEEDPDFWDKVRRLTLRYYFYYPEDLGMGGHLHDLEVAELDVELENTAEGCHRVIVQRATGFAHGLDWLSNEVEIQTDTRFPLTFLVEEGKHASCPDRNADGVYTPGYDVNRRVNDAWGVRDVIGSGFLGSSGSFRASMAKPREVEFRVGPPEVDYACESPRNSSFARSTRLLARYDLRRANRVPVCTDMGLEGERLAVMMADHGFGQDHEPRQRPSWDLGDLAEPLAYTEGWLPPIALRYDRSLGMSFTLPPLELGQFGYLVPRLNWIFDTNDVAIEAMLTPSASQFFSWYVSTGAAYERALVESPGFGRQPWGRLEWNFVGELGVKVRARMPGKWRIVSLGYHFAGIRLGVRNSGFDDFKSSRVVLELGAGIF